MNMLLLEPDEVGADGCALLTGRRAQHVATVLRAGVGQRLCAGILGGPTGTAEVLRATATALHLRVDCRQPPAPGRDVLLLAVPRPRVLLRVLELAAALGFKDILLCRSWRVDKSHLASHALDPQVQHAHLRLGLEQAQRTVPPRVQFFPLFKPFVEDVLPTLPLPAHRLCAHPDAATTTDALRLAAGAAIALAIGPEGGWLPYEVDQLATRGFLAVRSRHGPLRTEAAVAALHGQLDLLRHRQ